ncbi:response regulator [Breoghania sp.]|uniref:ATP-binding response regulator n=2 Tax=Pseudomonadati TaxID=3379134 RepID=UPI0029CA6FE5|nr:response regulator [Breoghania sp.]
MSRLKSRPLVADTNLTARCKLRGPAKNRFLDDFVKPGHRQTTPITAHEDTRMPTSFGTILVVDDSTTMRNVIKKILEPVGYSVLEAKNGIEALTMALSDSPPDLITLDVDMPKMDGFSACRKILSDYHENGVSLTKEKRPHIVFVTANDNVESRRQGFEAGAADFIAKPFHKEEVLATVERILSPPKNEEGMTALVVDDSALARDILMQNISREGWMAIEAENGCQALDIIKREKERIDIIITDLVMPEMDGITLCHTIRNDLHMDNVPIIFLTSVADQRELLKVFQAGATDYLVKPFFQEELLARLRVHIEKSMLVRQLRDTITESKRAEKERAEKERLQGVVEMAGAVCHELNQPIQTISGLTELMIMRADTGDPMAGYANKIKTQVDRMGKITAKLTNVATYRTKAHDGVTRIIDIDGASPSPPVET